jgi:hypothetical protein
MFVGILIVAALLSQDKAQIPSAIEHQPLNQQIFSGQFHAKSNLRYHIGQAARWGTWSRVSVAATLLLSALALMGPLVASTRVWQVAWAILGILAFIVASFQLVWPYGVWYADDTVLASKWNELANEWYTLYESQEDYDEKQLRGKIAALNAKAAEIESDQDLSRYDPAAYARAERDEKRYQGVAFEEPTPPFPIFLVLGAIIVSVTWALGVVGAAWLFTRWAERISAPTGAPPPVP